MYKIEITELAQDDLDEIVRYHVEQLTNPIAVTRFLDDVEKRYEYLATNPKIYAVSDDLRLRKDGFRKVLVSRYVVMFKVDEETEIVTIYRVLYAACDYAKLL